VRDACGLFQAVAEGKQISLECRASENLPARGDIRLIQRMLANLLDNAIKYTPEGGTVTVSVCSTPDRSIAIAVTDTGPGISARDLPHIFERFYRGDPSRSLPGVGLGLSFARAIARAHGGEIRVDSALARGSTFIVMLPASCATG
jgi:signal transduction histidine kinase